ncbi:MAG: DNA-processing protein DprA [Elusimicrobia bacterium]|nr:DNA-processing protein DprA [Elusimicrobiota bacterium]
MEENKKRKWIEFSLGRQITQNHLYALYRFNDDPFEIERTNVEELKNVIGGAAENLKKPVKKLRDEIRQMSKSAVRAVFIDEDEYPVLLKQTKTPPLFLRVAGKIPPAGERTIAIVGTRKSSSYGRRACEYFASEISARGFAVASGLAYGIDTVAHKTAIESGGKTIAVLGSGCDVIYPAANKRLAEEIKENGAILSEWPMGTPPSKKNFPMRNRIISGISCGVLVAEAPQKSGALITAGYAADEGRDVWVVCGDIFSANYRGCHALIKDGAKLCETIEDIMTELKFAGFDELEKKKKRKKPKQELQGEEKQIYEAVGWSPVSLDEIKALTKFEMGKIFRLLTNLEINGFIENAPGGKFVRKR